MGLFGLGKKEPARKVKPPAIFKRLETAYLEARRHEPEIAFIRLSSVDAEHYVNAGGPESPLYPKALKGVRMEPGRRSELVMKDESVVSI